MSYTNAIFYLDYDNGSDTARANIVPSDYANNGAGLVRVTVGVNTLVTGAVVTIAGTSSSLYIGDWKVTVINATTIDLQGSVYTSDPATKGTCTPFGGHAWGTDAWKTITGGAAGAIAAHIAPGDIIRIAKSPVPVSLGNGKWTNCQVGGGFPTAKSIVSSTNAPPIRIRVTAHGFSDGDVIYVNGHTSNAAANGAWVITNIATDYFDLVGSIGIGIGGANGTVQKINSKAVVLTTVPTFQIDRCEVAWVNGSGTASLLTTNYKEGSACTKVIYAGGANTKQAYRPTGTLAGATINGYQKLTFWLYNSAVIADATTWYIALCDDVLGANPIDTFPIPAIASTARWIPLTIVRCNTSYVPGGNCGGNASTDVKSVALWTGATVPAGSSYLYLDNFEVTTTTGLNLQSLISKNSLEQGGTEAWYGIQSINLGVVLLDNDTNVLGNAGRGYSTLGTSPETVPTYKRETIKTALVTGATTAVATIQDSGTVGLPIQFIGGYNTSNNAFDGETFFDGLNGLGYGLTYAAKNHLNIDRLNFFRYGSGFINITSTSLLTIFSMFIGNCTADGATFAAVLYCKITSLISNNNTGMGFSPGGSGFYIDSVITNNNSANQGSVFLSVNNISVTYLEGQNNIKYGLYINASFGVVIKTAIFKNNIINGFYSLSSVTFIKSLTTTGNSTMAFYLGTGLLTILNATLGEGMPTSISNYTDTKIKINKLSTTGFPRIEIDNGNIVQQAATAGGTGNEWKLSPTGTTRTSDYPLELIIARVRCYSGVPKSIGVYIKLSHGDDVGARLIVKGGQIAGSDNDVVITAPANTNRNLVTLPNITASENGVVEVVVQVYWLANIADENVIVDDLIIS